MYDFNLNALQGLKLEFYQKTYLTIRLHRIHSDNFNYFLVEHSFTRGSGFTDYIGGGQQFAKDTTLRVITAADVYTRIVWRKTVVVGQSNQQTDSLICTKNGVNVFDINY
jgi:hypothetical protein